MSARFRGQRRNGSPAWALSLALGLCAALAGCGKTLQNAGTEQLLASDAVDRSISKIDFSPLTGKTVYFDTKYIVNIKNIGFVNSEYIISGLRQQLVAAGCLLQDSQDAAEFIVEARVGALGGNQHEMIYGIPASNAASTVASILPNSPPVPAIPEVSLIKKSQLSATAKVAVFAYHRESKQAVWQSGTSVANSNAKDAWLFGAGPFQSGTVYDGARLGGARLGLPFVSKPPEPPLPGVAYNKPYLFGVPVEPKPDQVADEKPAEDGQAAPTADKPAEEAADKVQQAGHETAAALPPDGPPKPFPTEEMLKGSTPIPNTSPQQADPAAIEKALEAANAPAATTDPAPATDPAAAPPATSDPAASAPATTEPAATEPAATEQPATEPPKSEPAPQPAP